MGSTFTRSFLIGGVAPLKATGNPRVTGEGGESRWGSGREPDRPNLGLSLVFETTLQHARVAAPRSSPAPATMGHWPRRAPAGRSTGSKRSHDTIGHPGWADRAQAKRTPTIGPLGSVSRTQVPKTRSIGAEGGDVILRQIPSPMTARKARSAREPIPSLSGPRPATGGRNTRRHVPPPVVSKGAAGRLWQPR
jgi:hypothetical protein